MSAAASASWRPEDEGKRRCEVKLYTAEVGPAGSGAPEFTALMEAIAPNGWRWISVEYVEPGDDKPAAGAEAMHAAIVRLQSAVDDVRRELEDFSSIEDPNDLPSLYEVERAFDDTRDARRTLNRRLDEEAERHDDDG